MPDQLSSSLFSPCINFVGQAPPRLLVSVRSVQEASEALAGEADVIDVKEPANGSLGAASIEVIQEIAAVVAEQTPDTPVTVALGELNLSGVEREAAKITSLAESSSVVAVKVGLAGLKNEPWQLGLADLKSLIEGHKPTTLELIAVAYADDKAANSPTAEEVFTVANQLGLQGFLIDTYDKSPPKKEPHRGLFDAMSQERLSELLEVAQSKEITAAIAGSLTLGQLPTALQCKPAIIGVRGAVCEGGREGTVTRAKVRALCDQIKLATQ